MLWYAYWPSHQNSTDKSSVNCCMCWLLYTSAFLVTTAQLYGCGLFCFWMKSLLSVSYVTLLMQLIGLLIFHNLCFALVELKFFSELQIPLIVVMLLLPEDFINSGYFWHQKRKKRKEKKLSMLVWTSYDQHWMELKQWQWLKLFFLFLFFINNNEVALKLHSKSVF